jgi:hypothetical protein
MEILTLIMHERSIIFVSNNLTILSNIILGFQVLIRPFIWYHPLIQILPSALLGILDSPFPMIVGITHEDYQELQLSEQEKSLRTWVIITPKDASYI